MSVTMLVDNDVVIKLAKMDVYVDAMTAIRMESTKIGSLKVMLRYMGVSDAERRKRLTSSEDEAERLNTALQSIVELEMTTEEANISAEIMKAILQAGLDIQEGELALCVVAVSRGGLDFCTGDKRALQELPQLEQIWRELKTLRGRCICLEQLFEKLCSTSGLQRIRRAVTTAPRADETISFVYDQTSSRGDRAFIQGIQLVIRERINHLAPGWLKTF